MAKDFTWRGLLEPLEHELSNYGIDPEPAIDALFVSILLILLAFFAGRKYRKTDMVEPDGKLSFVNTIEFVLSSLLNLFSGIIHHPGAARKLYFLLGTFAFFILGNNLIGAVPGFNPPTDQFNVTIVLGLTTFLTAHFIGIQHHGFSYIKKFVGPVWWLSPLIMPIEIISHLVRPLSLSIRLFGNMTGDHKVVAAFFALVAIGIPIPFMGLGLLIAFLQTFVFILLAAVYFQDALEHPH